MKNTYKAALLAALGLTVVSAAQAQTVGTVSINTTYTAGDLLLGIYEPGSANTLVVDIGSYASLQNGETWSLSSYLTSAGITLDSSGQYGVIGANATTHHIYTTSTTSSLSSLSGGGANTLSSAIGTVGNNEGAVATTAVNASTAGADWYGQTLDYNASSSLLVTLGDYQVNANVGSSDTLYDATGSGTATHPTGTSVTDLSFNLSTDGTLTYGSISSVPEPATYGLLAGAGLLIVSLRNKLSRKQA